MGSVVKVELSQDVADVRAYCGLANEQLIGDIVIGKPLGDQAKHLDLASG